MIAVLLALGIQRFLVKPYKIPSGSMEPTLAIGQRVLVNRLGMTLTGRTSGRSWCSTRRRAPRNSAAAPRTTKSARAARPATRPTPKRPAKTSSSASSPGPGDTIYVKEGHAIVNGKRESDPYIKPCGGVRECNFLTPIKIPAGHWFMMGDNRGESDDSRFWGPVPTSWIIGGAFFTYWPPDRIGTL